MASVAGVVRLEGDALARVQEIAALLARPQAMWREIARRAANEFRAHFAQLDRTKANKLAPGRRQHFWAQLRDAVGTPDQTGELGASFAINDPRYGVHVFGGTIVPREARQLTIPVHALAYGRRAKVFEEETGKDLFRLPGKKVLFANLGKGQRAVAIYILADKAVIPPDPEALPPWDKLETACVEQAERHLVRVLERASQG